jgi:hypothetical protein
MFATDDRQSIRVAEEQVAYWGKQVEAVRREVERAATDLANKEHNLRTAEAFLELVRERYGVRVEPEPSTRFERLALREAALMIIKERERISRKELIAELQAGGFPLKEYPARRLHAALTPLHQKVAVKDANGYWCWVGPA